MSKRRCRIRSLSMTMVVGLITGVLADCGSDARDSQTATTEDLSVCLFASRAEVVRASGHAVKAQDVCNFVLDDGSVIFVGAVPVKGTKMFDHCVPESRTIESIGQGFSCVEAEGDLQSAQIYTTVGNAIMDLSWGRKTTEPPSKQMFDTIQALLPLAAKRAEAHYAGT